MIAGNAATEVTRTVSVTDTTAPVITLVGDAQITVEVGSTYTDLGATASDNYDGDISADIVTGKQCRYISYWAIYSDL